MYCTSFRACGLSNAAVPSSFSTLAPIPLSVGMNHSAEPVASAGLKPKARPTRPSLSHAEASVASSSRVPGTGMLRSRSTLAL